MEGGVEYKGICGSGEETLSLITSVKAILFLILWELNMAHVMHEPYTKYEI